MLPIKNPTPGKSPFPKRRLSSELTLRIKAPISKGINTPKQNSNIYTELILRIKTPKYDRAYLNCLLFTAHCSLK